MENQTVLIATAGFAAAGIAGYMYLNQSEDVESENAKLGTTKLSDLVPDNLKEEKRNWFWTKFWGQEHKKQQVMEELKETQASALYN
jgi:hypothetical protein